MADRDDVVDMGDVRVARAASYGDAVLGISGGFAWVSAVMDWEEVRQAGLSPEQTETVTRLVKEVARWAHEFGLKEGWERGKRYAQGGSPDGGIDHGV